RHGEDAELPVPQLSERPVEEMRRGGIAVVKVLEHDHHGHRRALGAEELHERRPHLLVHELRVPARGAEEHALLGWKWRADDLAYELGHPPARALRDPLADVHRQALPARPERLTLLDTARVAEELAEQAEGGAGAQRIAAGGPDRHRAAARLDVAQELVDE